jgi:hypothetical protein
MLVLEFCSGLSGTVRTVYLFSLCVVSLLSSRFAASALVWFSSILKCLVFHIFISLSTVFICTVDRHGTRGCLCTKVRSEWIGESWIENAGGFRCWNWRPSPWLNSIGPYGFEYCFV